MGNQRIDVNLIGLSTAMPLSLKLLIKVRQEVVHFTVCFYLPLKRRKLLRDQTLEGSIEKQSGIPQIHSTFSPAHIPLITIPSSSSSMSSSHLSCFLCSHCRTELKKKQSTNSSANFCLGHVDEGVNVCLIPLNVFVFNQPLNLFFDHLLLRKEHVL